MSLEFYESSVELARPIYLYQFSLGARVWRYASSATDVVTLDGYVWAACAISHDGVKQTGEAATDALTIDAPISIAPAQIYLDTPPSAAIMVTIRQKDVSDPEVWVIYSGEISQINVVDVGKVTVTCETISVSLRREGLRFGWQRACPYALYDTLTCKVNKADYAVAVTITAIDGYDITVSPDITPLIYPGGFVQWVHPVKGTEYLGIERQTNNILTIFGSPLVLRVGMPITIYRGCARTPAACQMFSNYANYGGVPNMPGVSPFDGSNPFY